MTKAEEKSIKRKQEMIPELYEVVKQLKREDQLRLVWVGQGILLMGKRFV